MLDLLPELPEPQRAALAGALRIAPEEPSDAFSVNVAAHALVVLAAERRPLLLVLDDVHWLDGASADALAFAARRFAAEEIAVLAAVRAGEPSAFDHGFATMELGALDMDAARALLADRREPVSSEAETRVLEAAGGNPLAVLELTGDPLDVEPAAPSERLHRAFARRLDAVSEEARAALLLAAAEQDAAAVRRAGAAIGLNDGLEQAERSQLVSVGLDGIAFRHPLLRSLVYAEASPEDRRASHRALAQALSAPEDEDRRAWHLAAATTGADEEVAALLEATAERAGARGGYAAQARALERAARLTIDDEVKARRLHQAAQATFWAGDTTRAMRLVEEALPLARDPLLHADLVHQFWSVSGVQREAIDERSLEAELESIAELDATRAVKLAYALATAKWARDDVSGALALAPRLEELAEHADAWWQPRARGMVAGTYTCVGDYERGEPMYREQLDQPAVTANYAIDLMWLEWYEEARSALESTLREGRAAGNRLRVVWNQVCLAYLELRLGRLDAAAAAAAEAITLGEAIGSRAWAGTGRSVLAGVHAWRGEEEACRSQSAQSLEQALTEEERANARQPLGLLALGLGRAPDAIDVYEQLLPRWDRTGLAEPSGVAFVPDLVEAYAHAGRRADAESLLDRFRGIAEHAERRWALAACERCAGILADDFDAPFGRAIELLSDWPLELDRARTQLAYGERLRRAGRRRDARPHLRAALDVFAAQGAAPWAERAAAELSATGERVVGTYARRHAELTPQELQIAVYVGEGKTNKEIAAAMFLSPKTVEYHLSNAFRKLDVHSRAELAKVVGGG